MAPGRSFPPQLSLAFLRAFEETEVLTPYQLPYPGARLLAGLLALMGLGRQHPFESPTQAELVIMAACEDSRPCHKFAKP
jgi:hypothetical protein